MKDLRVWLGKTGNKFTGTLLERCALSLTKRKVDRDLARSANTGGSMPYELDEEEIGVDVDYIFCEVFVLAIESNLFGPGEPLHMKKQGCSKDRGVGDHRTSFFAYSNESDDDFSTICDVRAHLNKDSLAIYSTGVSRMSEYFNVFLKEGDLGDTYRSEDADNGGVSLKSVKPLRKDADEESDMRISRATSTKYDVINDNYDSGELDGEILYLYDQLGDNVQQEGVSRTSKEIKIASVMKLRHEIKTLNRAWVSTRESEIYAIIESERGEQHNSIQDILKAELNNGFFRLDLYDTEKATKLHTFKRKKYIDASDLNSDDEDGSGTFDSDIDPPVPALVGDNTTTSRTRSRNSIGLGQYNFHVFPI